MERCAIDTALTVCRLNLKRSSTYDKGAITEEMIDVVQMVTLSEENEVGNTNF